MKKKIKAHIHTYKKIDVMGTGVQVKDAPLRAETHTFHCNMRKNGETGIETGRLHIWR